jgi:hypothetical protein
METPSKEPSTAAESQAPGGSAALNSSEAVHPAARPDFDPLAALYAANFEVEDGAAAAPIYDNLEACVAAISGKKVAGASKKKEDKTAAAALVEPLRLERRFLPEQMPVPVQRTPFRHVLIRMGEFSDGPLGRLRHFQEERIRIKVVITNSIKVPVPLHTYVSTAFNPDLQICFFGRSESE